MEELAPVLENGNDDVVANASLTTFSKQLLNESIGVPWARSRKRQAVEEELDSVYEIAASKNMTFIEFVYSDPEFAVMCAEMSYAKWTNVLTQVSLSGVITTEDGAIAVTRAQMNAIDMRIKQAKYELEQVQNLAASCSTTDGKKRTQLLRMLFISAVMRNDTRAMTYLIDRVDGRPGESRVAELSYDNAYNIYMILHTLFDKQLNVLNAGNGTILVCCSRRAGKSHMLVALSIIECMRTPNTTCIYIGETAELTEGIVDDACNKLIDSCHLQDKRGKRFNWRHMDNGSKLLVRGLSNTKDPDQIRGKGAKIIVIDEFFHLKSYLLEYLQREVLKPMQMDYADSYKFICAGTPPQTKGTYGEYAWKTWDVPHFTWTWRDNPHPVALKAREEYVEKEIADMGLTWETPFIRREYNGEWAYDDDLLLYPNYKVYDPEEAVPQWQISRILFGIDYGVSDCDSIVGIAWSDDEGKGYEFYEEKFSRLDIKDRTMTQLSYLKSKVMDAWGKAFDYFNVTDETSAKEANKRIYWDADDNDQHLTEELSADCVWEEPSYMRKCGLAIANAHKTDKKLMWDKIDELMRTGRLLIIKGGKLEHECVSTILKRGPNDEIYNEVDDAAYHPDLLPALRYCLWNVLSV